MLISAKFFYYYRAKILFISLLSNKQGHISSLIIFTIKYIKLTLFLSYLTENQSILYLLLTIETGF